MSRTRLQLTSLEDRYNPAVTASLDIFTGDLTVQGTNSDDTINIYQWRGELYLHGELSNSRTPISLQGGGYTYPNPVSGLNPKQVREIRVLGYGGNDLIRTNYHLSGDALADFGNNMTLKVRLDGGPGDDTLHGAGGADQLFGGPGRDKLYGEGANDLLDGGDNTDHLYGGSANDTLIGGAGGDWLSGEAGHDKLFANSLYADPARAAVDDLYLADHEPHRDPLREYMFGGEGNDMLMGAFGNDFLAGGGGHDTLYGMRGDDAVYGDEPGFLGTSGLQPIPYTDQYLSPSGWLPRPGNDSLIGGAGHDTLYGDSGMNLYEGTPLYLGGNDTLFGNDGHDRLFCEAGADVWNGGLGVDLISEEGGASALRKLLGYGPDRAGADNHLIMKYQPGYNDEFESLIGPAQIFYRDYTYTYSYSTPGTGAVLPHSEVVIDGRTSEQFLAQCDWDDLWIYFQSE